MIRYPYVSGAFYPDNKIELQKLINGFLAKTKIIAKNKKIKILIVPHAGYQYSGLTAAWGFKQLENTNINKIIIIGISHRSYFSNATVFHQGSWLTPLGKIEVNQALAQNLINQSPLFKADCQTHSQEHSLEVQLPFLQTVLKNFQIVPILLGQIEDSNLETIAKVISKNWDDKTLLLISSDLSHYPPYEVANIVDEQTIQTIIKLDVLKFNKVIQDNLAKPGVETCACGERAIKVGMLTAKLLNCKTAKLIHYSNSADFGGDKNQVVGYGSIGIYE